MYKNNNLAIVIPAYKIDYLDDCLSSIARQTNKNFTLYIGNDNSPYNIESIVNKYRTQLNLVYKRFSENLGSTSLVKQWERCIEMSGEEEWIWLFSDDDMMEEAAVDCFMDQKKSIENVYRFNLKIVDINGKFLREIIYQESESAISFLRSRLSRKYDNVITNYIFSKGSYSKNNGFVDFPLAWGSDDASIIQFAEEGNIILIPKAAISWRSSGTNITTNFNHDVLKRKVEARYDFVNWLYTKKLYLVNQIADNKKIVGDWFYYAMQVEYNWASKRDKFKIIRRASAHLGNDIYKIALTDIKRLAKNKLIKILRNIKYTFSSSSTNKK